MRTTRQLFATLGDEEFLDGCATLCARGKRRRPDVARFLFHREREIRSISCALRAGSWRPSGFSLLFVREPKPRAIARAPFDDRVVHRALVRLVESVFSRSYSDSSFACRPGLGAHRAVLAILRGMRRHRFALHLDLKSYFPSIDPELVSGLLRERIDDDPFLAVVERVLASGRGLYDSPRVRRFARLDPDWPPRRIGLPIGASTSQCFAAQLVLLELDHAVKRELGVPCYVRYVDDLFLLGGSARHLREARAWVARWVSEERGLRLKHPDAEPRSTRRPLHALGHRITRRGLEPLPRAERSLVAALRREVWRAHWGGEPMDVEASLTARMGVLGFG